MKTKFLFSFLFVSIISIGQTSSTHVQTLVNSVSSEITLDTEQINQLTIAAEQYVLAIQAANEAAQEMQENGISISELQTQLLQEIEELTLYLIQQEQIIQELRQEVEQLKQ